MQSIILIAFSDDRNLWIRHYKGNDMIDNEITKMKRIRIKGLPGPTNIFTPLDWIETSLRNFTTKDST